MLVLVVLRAAQAALRAVLAGRRLVVAPARGCRFWRTWRVDARRSHPIRRQLWRQLRQPYHLSDGSDFGGFHRVRPLAPDDPCGYCGCPRARHTRLDRLGSDCETCGPDEPDGCPRYLPVRVEWFTRLMLKLGRRRKVRVPRPRAQSD